MAGMFVRRPIGVATMALAVVALALVALPRIPVQLVPEGGGGSTLSLNVPWRNASPQEMENAILRPLEEELRTIPGIKTVTSRTRESSANVSIEFGQRQDMDLAVAEVRDRIERVRPRLPDDVDRIWLWRFNMDENMPVIWMGIATPEITGDSSRLVENVFKRRLETVDGVGGVNIYGTTAEAARIYLDTGRVEGARSDIGGLVGALMADNFVQPVGRIDLSGERTVLRVDMRIEDLAELEAYPLADGRLVSDLGEVRVTQSVRDQLSRIDGDYAFYGSISLASGANAVEVAREVRAEMKRIEDDGVLPGLHVTIFFDQGQMISEALTGLGRTALYGGLLAVVVLYLFLRRVKLTMLVAGAIPLSMLVSILYLFFSGSSFNLLSLMGITLAAGMLVDNSVVVGEAILARREKTRSGKEAASQAPREVALALTLATLTTVVVFAPLIFMGSDRNTRIYMEAMGFPLCVALLASLGVALIVIPAAAARILGDGGKVEIHRGGLIGVGLGMNRRLVPWLIRHRVVAVIAGLAVLGAAVPAIQNRLVPTKVGQREQGKQVKLGWTVAPNTTLAEVSRAVRPLEDWIGERREELDIAHSIVRFSTGDVSLTLHMARDLEDEEEDALREKIRGEAPKSPVLVKRSGVRSWWGEDSDMGQTVRLRFTGPDTETLFGVGVEARALLEATGRFHSVEMGSGLGGREVQVTLDRERLTAAGLDPASVYRTVGFGLRGMQVTRLDPGGLDLPVILEFDEEDPDFRDLEELRLWSEAGESIPLAAVADFRVTRGPRSISRINGRTSLTLRAKPRAGGALDTSDVIDGALAGMSVPRGVAWEEQGGRVEFQQVATEIGKSLALSLVLVFLLMGILFESVLLPAAVLVTIPFALWGAYFAVWASGRPLDEVGLIGFVILVGIVVNNGIVLVDKIGRLRRKGVERGQAIAEACEQRLRPILMTAGTTVTGLLPMILTAPASRDGIDYRSLATVVAGGLAVSTLFTLWSVPVAYTILDDLGSRLARLARWALRLPASRTATVG